MDAREPLRALQHRWAAISSNDTLDPDNIVSLIYFHLDSSSKYLGHTSSRRAMNWIGLLRELEKFIATHARLPRRNARRSREAVDPTEERLAHWVRHQRRSTAGLCTYQRERLDCVPGFSWAPKDDAWDDQFWLFKNFGSEQGVLPLLNGQSAEERRLARWRRTQVARYRKGALEKHRADDLETIDGWCWE